MLPLLVLRQSAPFIGSRRMANKMKLTSRRPSSFLLTGSSFSSTSNSSTSSSSSASHPQQDYVPKYDSYERTWKEMLQLVRYDQKRQRRARSRQEEEKCYYDVIDYKNPKTDLQEILPNYDKVLILINHGEDESQLPNYYTHLKTTNRNDPSLTGRGIGQGLTLSRIISTLYLHTKETSTSTTSNDVLFIPELILCSPTIRTIYTSLLCFPHLSQDLYNYNNNNNPTLQWLCHYDLYGSLVDNCPTNTNHIQQFKKLFPPGIDYTYSSTTTTDRQTTAPTTLYQSKSELLDRTDHFTYQFLKKRDEKIIAISSHSSWFQAFCGHTLIPKDTQGNTDTADNSPFFLQNGDLKIIGINFSSSNP